jgi:hypothetical protein
MDAEARRHDVFLQQHMENVQRAEEEDAEGDEEPMDVEDDPAFLDNMNNNDDGRPKKDLMDDDPLMDADLNIALDELLGVRGPLWVVVRNLLWLLAFNTLYLALFGFLPRILESVAPSLGSSHNDFNNTNRTTEEEEEEEVISLNATQGAEVENTTTTLITDYSLMGVFDAVEKESTRLGTTFCLKYFGQVSPLDNALPVDSSQVQSKQQ